ncbi:MAG: hypothetical protein M3067_14150 [Chloroflexota bacterium]|nr:hypothetical protein [Chloroflexota bacterium]
MDDRKNDLPRWEDAGATTPTEPVNPPARPNILRRNTKATIAGSLLIGGIAGAAIMGPLSAAAASPDPSALATPAATEPAATTAPDGTTAPAATAPGVTTPSPTADTDGDKDAGRGGLGPNHETVTDTSVVAKAIGISETDLLTALNGGKTVADVAKANNVAVQSVIDALVADGNTELAADVASGRITQAQADAEKAEITQRATDQVNGSFKGGPGGHDGRGGFGPNHETVTDTSVVAKAIGISETDLVTALNSGKTVADVAKANNVAVQTVIDALVADGNTELAADVASGRITQAQADAEKAEITQRATDQVNGSLRGH